MSFYLIYHDSSNIIFEKLSYYKRDENFVNEYTTHTHIHIYKINKTIALVELAANVSKQKQQFTWDHMIILIFLISLTNKETIFTNSQL